MSNLKYLIIFGLVLLSGVLSQSPSGSMILGIPTCGKGEKKQKSDCVSDTSFTDAANQKCCLIDISVDPIKMQTCVQVPKTITEEALKAQAELMATSYGAGNAKANFECASSYISVSFFVMLLAAFIF